MNSTTAGEADEDRKRGQRLYPRKNERNYWVLTELREALTRCLEKNVSGRPGVMVDYGCGNMPYKSLFEASGVSYQGYDFAGNDLASGYLGADGSLPLADASVDYVISSQVLEHVTDVSYYLSEASRVLKSGGTLILSTHGVWRYHPDPTDFWRWTGDGLVKVIVDCGFTMKEIVGVVGPAATGIKIFQDAVFRKIPGRLQPLFFRGCQQAMMFFDRRCPAEVKSKDASVFVCVATIKK